MSSRIVFAFLVAVLVGGMIFISTWSPSSDEPAGENAQQTVGATSAAQDDGLPRANVEPADAPVGVNVGNRAPQFALRDPQGNLHRLSDYQGQIVVLDFWATWCGPCKVVMPALQDLHEEYESRGVRVIGLSGNERGGNPAKYMADNDYTYGLLLNAEKISSQYQIRAIPTIFVVGVDGTILYKHVGVTSKADLEQVIDRHLQKHGL